MPPAREPGTTVVDAQGIPIEVEIRGEGRPILLVHGWSADRRYMIADLEPVFADVPGWQRIYFDLPGHGATPAPDWLERQDQMLAILHDLIDVVLPEGQFAVAGNSYGGLSHPRALALDPRAALRRCVARSGSARRGRDARSPGPR